MMRTDPEVLARHYASLTDEALEAIDPDELTDVARATYDHELARRNLSPQDADSYEVGASGPDAPPAELDGDPSGELDIDVGPDPGWLDDAACACAFAMQFGSPYVANAAKARAALRAAGIPCHITMNPSDPANPDAPQLYCVMVPGALNLHATSVLDRAIFNEEHEADFRTHLEALSDDELRALDPELICAGLVDRVTRLKRAYQDETALRARGRN